MLDHCTWWPWCTPLQHSNTTLLSKWVIRVMKPSSDMVSMLLREVYGHSLNWNKWATPRWGDSLVVAGLLGILPLVWPFFRPQLGHGAHFRFWEDDWSGLGRLGDSFPRLYALAMDSAATVQIMLTGAWTPILPNALSDQRLVDFMSLEVRLAKLRLPAETQDTRLWCQFKFSAMAVYCLLRGQAPLEAISLVQAAGWCESNNFR